MTDLDTALRAADEHVPDAAKHPIGETTMADLQELVALLEKATPGKYYVVTGKRISVGPCPGQAVAICNYDNGPIEKANAAAIAAAINFLRSPAFAEMAVSARRYEWLRSRANQKTAYDVFGDGGHWTVGVHSNDNRLTLDAAIDAAASGGG